MARSGMTNLITRTRRLINDTASATWTDTELQDVLDLHKLRIWREPLEREKTNLTGTTYEYRLYYSRQENLEEVASGTAYFHIEDSTGAAKGSADYTMDYIRGMLTMDADQGGTALYISGWTFDINAAAGDCWREVAGGKAGKYDVSADGHRMSRSQLMKQAIDMAKYYDGKSKPVSVRQWTNGISR